MSNKEREDFIQLLASDPALSNDDRAYLLKTRDTLVVVRSISDAEKVTQGRLVDRGSGLFELRVRSRFSLLLELKAFGFRVLRIGTDDAED